MFIVELTTKTGMICEAHATYEEAKRRIEMFPAESLIGMPLLFEELPDGSQRLVREDGKPLQWHRLPEDRPAGPDEALPMCDESSDLLGKGRWKILERPGPQDADWDDEPIPFNED